MMATTVCERTYSRLFSEIEGLQAPRTLTYSLFSTPDGARFSLEQTTVCGVSAEACLCPTLSLTHAVSLLQYIYENGFEFGCWLDMLDDMNIAHCPA